MDQTGLRRDGAVGKTACSEIALTFFRRTLLACAVVACATMPACTNRATPGHPPSDGGGTGDTNGGDAGMLTGIVVTTPSGVVASESWDGYCDILEAVAAANTGQAVHECTTGGGVDRIVLTAGATYPILKTVRLETAITMGIADSGSSSGSGSATISAAEGFFTTAGDPWSGCLVHAAVQDGVVKLTDVTLTQSPATSVSGACVTHGSFEIRRGRVTGFLQGGIAGYCLPEFGCDQENNSSDSTTIKVIGSIVDGNRSPRNGGGISSQGSGMTLEVVHSSIINNVSELSGGGAWFGGGWSTQRIDQSTVSGNTASTGGGVFVNFTRCTATYLYVLNSTIANNTALSTGGGIEFKANTDCYSQDVTVLASIVNNNKATTTMQTNINADWTGGQFNCDRGSLLYVAPDLPTPSQALGTPCRFDVPDALLGPLMPMGGTGNLPLHPPLRGSPAIDAATDDLAADQQRDSWVALLDPVAPPTWELFDRVVDGDGDGTAVRDVGAYEANDVWQTELLAVADKGSATHVVVTTPDGYNRGAGTSYAAKNARDQFVTYALPIAETGDYAISVGVKQATDGGQFQVTVADGAGGPWVNIGAPQDTFTASSAGSSSSASAFAEVSLAAVHNFASAGPKLFRFTVTGKNAASAGYQLFLDYIKVTRLP